MDGEWMPIEKHIFTQTLYKLNVTILTLQHVERSGKPAIYKSISIA